MLRVFRAMQPTASDYWLTPTMAVLLPLLPVGFLELTADRPIGRDRCLFILEFWAIFASLMLLLVLSTLFLDPRRVYLFGRRSIAVRGLWGRCRRISNTEAIRVVWQPDNHGLARIESADCRVTLWADPKLIKSPDAFWLVRHLRHRFPEQIQEHWGTFAYCRALPLRERNGEDVYGEPHCSEHAERSLRTDYDVRSIGLILSFLPIAILEYWLAERFSVAILMLLLLTGWCLVRRSIPEVGPWHRKSFSSRDAPISIALVHCSILCFYLAVYFMRFVPDNLDYVLPVKMLLVGVVAIPMGGRMLIWLHRHRTRPLRERQIAARHAWAERRWDELETRSTVMRTI